MSVLLGVMAGHILRAGHPGGFHVRLDEAMKAAALNALKTSAAVGQDAQAGAVSHEEEQTNVLHEVENFDKFSPQTL